MYIYNAGVSQINLNCSHIPDQHFVTLDCPNSEVSNLQECGVMAVSTCDCSQTVPRPHATATCWIGKDMFKMWHKCVMQLEAKYRLLLLPMHSPTT